jgi:16S rRNA (adenine1518-N6/adenine1519-N6)-dimethyltransferase
MNTPKKSLGQHWLTDEYILGEIANAATVEEADTVLEIGPGLGTLTAVLTQRVRRVVAVEFDGDLARQLAGRVKADNLTVIHQDILSYNLGQLPTGYKVVANVPYYITSKIIQLLSEAHNPPSISALLVQREVAERLAARPGDMSIMSVAAQLYHEVDLGIDVPAYFFTPPPKVDSQVVVLRRRTSPLFADLDTKHFFTVVRAGFSERRKKLRSSLSGGLRISKEEADALLARAGISPEVRAQELSLEQWHTLSVAHG